MLASIDCLSSMKFIFLHSRILGEEPNSTLVWENRVDRSALLAALAPPQFEMIQRGNHERVTNSTGAAEVGHFVHRDQASDQILAMIKSRGVLQTAVSHKQRVTGIAHEGGIRKYFTNDDRCYSVVTRFFTQFTQASDNG